MSEKRFKLSKYVTPSSVSNFCDENGRMLNKEVVKVLNEQQVTISALKEENEQLKKQKSIVDKFLYVRECECESLKEENEQLKEQVKRLQDIGTRTEEEKEHFADLYNECRRFKLSDEQITQAYADLNRREREKHSQGNATYTSKINPNEVIY